MLKIGVTGGIGSGKSTVCNILKNLGVPVFTSDMEGRKLLNTDEALKTKVKQTFDEDMYTSNGDLDRERMASLVFYDANAMEKLTQLVHPLVKEKFKNWCKKHTKKPYVIKEAAILFETGMYHDLDKVVTVFCPKELRIDRIIKRDKTTREHIEKRIRFQYTDNERNQLADFIIVNDGKEDLLPQVMELHEILLNENSKKKAIF